MLAKQKALSSRPAKGHFISKIGHSRLIKKGFSNARDVGGGEKSRSSWSPAKQEHRWMHDGTFGICFNIAHAILVRLFLEILTQHFTILQKLCVIY